MTTTPINEDTILSHIGRNIIEHVDNKEIESRNLPAGSVVHNDTDSVSLPQGPAATTTATPPVVETDPPVGIVGAGCAGLYAALIFDSLNIKYEILEADNRIGGRVNTYHFPQKPGQPTGTHDYYDLGPMRFPQTPIMRRLFNLFSYDKLNTNGIDVEKHRIPYYFDTRDGNGIQYYNGNRKRLNVPATVPDPFNAKAIGVDDIYISIGYDKLYGDVIGPFAKGLEDDLTNGTLTGWAKMLQFDSYSTRSYMSHAYTPSADLVKLGLPAGKPLPTDVVSWLETLSMTTGWYDRALTTTVLEELSFGYSTDPARPKTQFWCFDGGSEVLTNAMNDYLEKTHPGRILKEHRVTSISIKNPTQPRESQSLDVAYVANGTKAVKTYSHVIATAPITVLRHAIDLSEAGLSPMQSNALRSCAYTPATKIAMKFKSAWWTSGKDASGKPIVDRDGKTLNIVGGRSFTDRPIRVVVYPSYGLNQDGPAVLICSFVWTEDAARIGAMIGSGLTSVDDQLKDLVLRDLAAVHNIDRQVLDDQYLDMKSVDWADNPSTMGAFALFGPGKFGSVYSSLTLPAGNGRLHFAGEAVSVRHGWIVGALDSTWRAICEYLIVSHPDKVNEFTQKWGFQNEWLPTNQSRSGNKLANNLLLKHLNTFTPEVFDLNAAQKATQDIHVDAHGAFVGAHS